MYAIFGFMSTVVISWMWARVLVMFQEGGGVVDAYRVCLECVSCGVRSLKKWGGIHFHSGPPSFSFGLKPWIWESHLPRDKYKKNRAQV